MIDLRQEERKCREKKMEKEDGLRTVECLRGRLFAERQASRIANEDAELLSKKLMELEEKLKEEEKLRNKAEKRLNKLMKKLQSLNLSHSLEESDRSSSSAMSCLSSAGTSASKEEEEHCSKSQIADQEKSERLDQNAAEKISPHQVHESPPIGEISNLQDAATVDSKDPSFDEISESTRTSHEEPKTGNPSSSPRLDQSAEGSDNGDYAGDSWALIPVDFPVETKRYCLEPKIVDKNVSEVLEALKLIREWIQSSIETHSF